MNQNEILKCADVVSNNNVFQLEDHASLTDAITLLHTHKISACPVVDTNGHPMGWISWTGIIRFASTFVLDDKNSVQMSPRSTALTTADLQRLTTLCGSETIHGALQASKSVKKVKSLRASAPLYRAIKLLSKGRYHRVPLTDASGKLVAVLSQRDILKFYATNPERLGPMRLNSVRGLAMGSANVSCVRDTDLVLDAFFRLADMNIGGMGVVNASGKLVSNLSVTDLGRCKGDFSLLQKSVRDYLNLDAGKTNVLTATDGTTLEELLVQMYKATVRRLYLVNAEGEPAGIVSLTDVCAAILRSLAKPEKKDQSEGKKDSNNNKNKKKKKKGMSKFEKHLEKEANKKGAKHSSGKGGKKKKGKK